MVPKIKRARLALLRHNLHIILSGQTLIAIYCVVAVVWGGSRRRHLRTQPCTSGALRLNVLTATWELITNARSGPDVCDRADPAVVFVSGLYSESGPLRPHLIRYNNIQQSITKPFDGTCSAFCCCFFPPPAHLSVGQSCIAPYFKAQ